MTDPPASSGYEVVTLKSGVLAMRDRASGEVMHIGSGPLVESHEVYVGPSRLAARLASTGEPLVVFDVGLGAASNAIAAWRVSEARTDANARRLEIVSFENDLTSLELALDARHSESFGLAVGGAGSADSGDARAAANALLSKGRHETERTVWRLALGDFEATLAREPDASADVVFWDMYSAKTCPALWSVRSLRNVRRACRAGATLHTYSASTSTRSGLLLAGFSVGVGGPTGERDETTIAAVCTSDLARPLDAAWLGRLGRSSVPFPRDVLADPDETERAHAIVRAHPQFARVPLSVSGRALARGATASFRGARPSSRPDRARATRAAGSAPASASRPARRARGSRERARPIERGGLAA
jgi:queuine tRNA-ribosyltransferase